MTLHKFLVILLIAWMVLWAWSSSWVGVFPVVDLATLFNLFLGFVLGLVFGERDDVAQKKWRSWWVPSVVSGVLQGVIWGVIFGVVHWIAAAKWIGALFWIDVAFGLGFGLLVGLGEIVLPRNLCLGLYLAWGLLWIQVISRFTPQPINNLDFVFTLFIGFVLGAMLAPYVGFIGRLRMGRSLKGSVVGGVLLGAIVGLIRWMADPGGGPILFAMDIVFGLGLGVLLGLPSALVQQESP